MKRARPKTEKGVEIIRGGPLMVVMMMPPLQIFPYPPILRPPSILEDSRAE